MNKILETERLVLREFDLDDAPFILELLNTPTWIEFIGNKKVHSLADAEEYIKNGPLKSYGENGFGLSMVELKFVRVPIGMCGLIDRDSLDDVDIGFAMLPEFAGSGYGYEIAAATVEYARKDKGLDRIVGITKKTNRASIGLLEKIGLTYEKTTGSLSDGEADLLFGIDF